MKYAQDIILRPIVTEESMINTASKKYTFAVAKDANKIEIKNAIETVFNWSIESSVPEVNVLPLKTISSLIIGATVSTVFPTMLIE